MEKTYNPQAIEQKIYAFWEENDYFVPRGSGDPFCIVIPPPNVTGALHIGHALDNSLQDILIRYKRMKGCKALWIPGTDHAGIATQNVVEKQLHKEGLTRHDLGREAFVQRVWEWKAEYGGRITNQLRRLGCSVDWHHERFTMDEGCSRAVRTVFVTLFKEGLIYQGDYIINWCPRCHTALSDVEVEHEDLSGHFWHIKYPLTNGEGYIEIATTRPETMFGDTAVAVHPSDERYKNFIGKQVSIPYCDRQIPIIADEHVDPAFGSGAVKVTPAHDPNDYEIGRRHNLEFIKIMDESAVMNQNAPNQYQGMDRYVCRAELVRDLQRDDLLLEEEDHVHAVGHCYRCHTVVEPYLSTQWFVDMKKLVGPAVDVVRSKKIAFIPERWEKLYFDWMENIRDWCISRQIWWGHRIPVWYCDDCGEVLCELEDPVSCACGSSNLRQDPDVLDTWFSSALWPFSTLGWPEKTRDLETFYPTSVLVTGYDIITFWVSRMITMGLKFMKDIPFAKVLIHGLVRDEKGRKMSKSTGNAIDPIVVMDEYGTDALRFALASLTTSGGQDIKLSTDKIAASRNFANKLWNVTRYILMTYEEVGQSGGLQPEDMDLADRWMMSSRNRTIQKVTELFENFEFGSACNLLYQFVWSDFCDWYVELSKQRKQEAMPVLIGTLKDILAMLHPFMPFLTESLWGTVHQAIGDQAEPLIISSWPKGDDSHIDDAVEEKARLLFSVISSLRNLRADAGVVPGEKLKACFHAESEETRTILEEQSEYVTRLAQLSEFGYTPSKVQESLYALAGSVEIFIPASGILDVSKEAERLEKKLTAVAQEIQRLEKKLSNTGFVSQAPAEVVEKERDKKTFYEEQQERLKKQLIMIKRV